MVSIQNPLLIDVHNEPKPDVVVFKPREDFYASTDRTPEHVLLLVEISDTTLTADRNVKLRHYASERIPEFWVEDIKHDLLHVYREPSGDAYKTYLMFQRGDSISPLAFPDVVLRVADLLG